MTDSPPGSHSGQRWLNSPFVASRFVTRCGRPRVRGHCRKPGTGIRRERQSSSPTQLPPRPTCASHRRIGMPPESGTFLSCPSAKNATQSPVGREKRCHRVRRAGQRRNRVDGVHLADEQLSLTAAASNEGEPRPVRRDRHARKIEAAQLRGRGNGLDEVHRRAVSRRRPTAVRRGGRAQQHAEGHEADHRMRPPFATRAQPASAPDGRASASRWQPPRDRACASPHVAQAALQDPRSSAPPHQPRDARAAWTAADAPQSRSRSMTAAIVSATVIASECRNARSASRRARSRTPRRRCGVSTAATARLLGTHVRGGADDDALARSAATVDRRRPSASSSRHLDDRLGEPEIEHLDDAVRRHLDVGRLQIAVNDAFAREPPRARAATWLAIRNTSGMRERPTARGDRRGYRQARSP